jgi:threonine/homoserine/homoserine lactone efflux protein
MMDTQVIAFTVAAAALTIAPGPDTMLVIRNVVRGGRREGVITTFGICSGLFVHATLSALGVSIILARSATAFSVMKLAGACYLGWLGLQSLSRAMGAPDVAERMDPAVPLGGNHSSQCFLEGLLSNVLNPKTAMFYLAFLPQFISPSDSVLRRAFLLTSIHYMEAVLWLGADRLRSTFGA